MKAALKKRNDAMEAEIVRLFKKLDTSDFPDFHSYRRILERGLWVLWVAKEKLGTRKLKGAQIASIIRDVKEVSIEVTAIAQSFKRAGRKVHVYLENGEILYEIMREGKEYLLSLAGEGKVELLYFEPGEKFTSKKLFVENILHGLEGELRIVDPYCGDRALDTLQNIKDRPAKFLTRLENLRDKDRNQLLREIRDFKSENTNIEFRNYPNTDIHDRYIISPSSLVILGHSIKDLGSKESFAIVLNEASSRNIYEALSENFNRRWKQSSVL